MPKPNIGQGDNGKTSLLGGKKTTWKDSLQVEAYGSLDELVSLIGYARAKCGVSDTPHKVRLSKNLIKIQDHLFRIESHVSASPKWKKHPALPYVGEAHVNFLKDLIVEYEKNLPELKNFILPGGPVKPLTKLDPVQLCEATELSALFHMARAKSRQVERRLIALNKSKQTHPFAIPYLNRLSDVFFTMSRWINWKNGIKEEDWIGRGKKNI